MGHKKPKIREFHTLSKIPRIESGLINPRGLKPNWILGTIDLESKWSWNIEKELFLTDIFPKIKYFETMTWNEILNRNNHEVELTRIIRDAQQRLEELRLEDTDKLVSLRLSNKQRIWGILINNTMKVLWWDPNHEVCPSLKD